MKTIIFYKLYCYLYKTNPRLIHLSNFVQTKEQKTQASLAQPDRRPTWFLYSSPLPGFEPTPTELSTRTKSGT
jgi:hypothetical protein